MDIMNTGIYTVNRTKEPYAFFARREMLGIFLVQQLHRNKNSNPAPNSIYQFTCHYSKLVKPLHHWLESWSEKLRSVMFVWQGTVHCKTLWFESGWAVTLSNVCSTRKIFGKTGIHTITGMNITSDKFQQPPLENNYMHGCAILLG